MPRSAVLALLSVLVPPCCSACRTPLEAAGPLCPVCRAALRRLPGACARCALPSHDGRGCPAATSRFDAAWAGFAHEGPARALVHRLKLSGHLPLASFMAAEMAPGVPRLAGVAPGVRSLPPARPVLVPVPASPARRRRRGFDPAQLLAGRLAESTGLEVAGVLRRRDRSPRQVRAGAADRRAPGRVVVETVRRPPELAVLVDDVHTTGATLDACAAALKAAGSRRVAAVTFGRTL